MGVKERMAGELVGDELPSPGMAQAQDAQTAAAGTPPVPAGVIAFLEQQALDNARFRMAAVDRLHKRAHELTLLLLGGAGGLGAYGLGKLGAPMIAWALLGMSAWGFAVGGVVVWKCLRSRTIAPLYNAPEQLWQAWNECRAGSQGDEAWAAETLRLRDTFRVQQAIDSISKANAHLAKWLNRGYALAMCLPLAGALGALLAHCLA